MFIRAERTSNWNLHLISVERMLPLFAATGHIHYAKSARLYLQMMLNLPNDAPWLYEQFAVYGNHAIHRTAQYWKGIWSDLAIEQVLMRSIKSRGGLTRGKGMTDSVRYQWVHSIHHLASIHNAMTTVTNLTTKSSEQHMEPGTSRRKRDTGDIEKVMDWLSEHDPFDDQVFGLRSLSTGVTAKENVNCDEAVDVGITDQ